MDNHLPPGRVILMAGVPGSGKTHYVNKLGLSHESVVSADNFFVEDGVYRFDPTKLGAAHGDCLRGFVAALMKGLETVVVDNTNTTVIEMSPYVALAAAYGYETEIVRVVCDPAVAAARNSHGVPERAVRAMSERLERTFQEGLPPFWDVTVTVTIEENAAPLPIQGENDALDQLDGPELWDLRAVYRGFPVRARRVTRGHWCGYITVPADHPWSRMACTGEYGETVAPDEMRLLGIDVHGSCTYAECEGAVDGIGNLTVGFDCAHFADGIPPWMSEREAPSWGTYRDLSFVRAELLSLAEQAEQAARNANG